MLKTKRFSLAAAVFLTALILIMPLISTSAAASSNIYDGVITRNGTYNIALLDADFYDSSVGCLTPSQEEQLLNLMQETADEIECHIGIAIVSDLHGMSDIKYADSFGDSMFGTGSSFVVLLLLNTHDNPQYGSYQDRISTSGLGRDYYDKRISKIFDTTYDGLDSRGFSGACISFCSALKSYRSSGGYSSGSFGFHVNLGTVFFSLITGIVISIIIVNICRAGYKKKKPISASHYIDTGRTRIDRQIDHFVREYTTSVHISSSSSSGGHHGGGGGSHRSGGHGGGGGRHR